MPAAIFYVSGGVITVAFIALSVVRLPKIGNSTTDVADVEESTPATASEHPNISRDTLVGVPEGLEGESILRGRTKSSSSSD